MLACGPEHRLADEAEVEMAELAEETFVDFHQGWISRDDTDRSLAAAQVDRRVALEVNDAHLLLGLVAAGLGVALVPASFMRKQTDARFVPLREPAPQWRTVIATAAGRRLSAAAMALLADESLGGPNADGSPGTGAPGTVNSRG